MPISAKPQLHSWTKKAAQNGPAKPKKPRSKDAGVPVTMRIPPALLKESKALAQKLGIDYTAFVVTSMRRQLKQLTNQEARNEFKLDTVAA